MHAIMDDIDPAAYAGEGFTATEEIPRADDIIGNDYVRGRVGHEEEYWPGPKGKGKNKSTPR